MRTIICGSRSIVGSSEILAAMERVFWPISVVISGGALGADTVGEAWAKLNGVPVVRVLPDWKRFGASAGFIRNTEMVAQAEAIIALWDGNSKGTLHTVKVAQIKGIPGVGIISENGDIWGMRWWTP